MTRATVRTLLLAASCFLPGCHDKQEGQGQPGTASQEYKDWEDLVARMESGGNEVIGNRAGRTLSDSTSRGTVPRIEKLVNLPGRCFKGEPEAVKELGGAEGFKKTLRKLLADDDPVVEGWAALCLGGGLQHPGADGEGLGVPRGNGKVQGDGRIDISHGNPSVSNQVCGGPA